MFLKLSTDEGVDVADTSAFEIVDGHIAVPTGPRLGVEIDEERVREASARARMWHNPGVAQRRRDGG